MTKVIIPLLQAPATIKGFLFLNNNIQNYAPNEGDEINEVAAGINVYFTSSHRYHHLNNSSGLSN